MDRGKIDDRYKWDLSKIYDGIDKFNEDMEKVKNTLGEFDYYRNVTYDENNLYELLSLYMSVRRKLSKLEVYTSLLCDEDMSISKNRELKERVNNLASSYTKSTYFINPNILKLDYQEIINFMKKNNKLKEFKRYFELLFRYKKHTLTDDEEKLLANLSKIFDNNYETYELMKDSDMSFPNFFVNDKEYELDNSKYGVYMEHDDRMVRETAFTTLYKMYKQYRNVYANLLISHVKEYSSIVKIKKFNSSIEASLFDDELDLSIYNNLIDVVNNKIGILHKYYKLKKDVLNLPELHLYDVYVNLVSDNNNTYKFDDSKETVINALSILGEDYINILKKGIEDRWIDVYPNRGKRTGGYSSGCYDTNPYILLNYQDKYDDMSTLAHELGHSMHSYYTIKNNPFQYGHYSIFVAEVASTVNELLLAKYIIKNSTNKNEKLFILNRIMELFRATFYRQAMFSEFEKKVYSMIEEEKEISVDILCDEYYKLNKFYFGDNVYVDEEIKYEWERIPHFFYNFYVYKYATGLSVASYIVNGLLEGKITSDQYISFLKCGNSVSPLDSLKVTSVDLSNSKVFEEAVSMFDQTIEEFRKIYFDR